MVTVHYRQNRPTLQLEMEHHERGARPARKDGVRGKRNARGRLELPGGAKKIVHWRSGQTRVLTAGAAALVKAAAERQGCLADFVFTEQVRRVNLVAGAEKIVDAAVDAVGDVVGELVGGREGEAAEHLVEEALDSAIAKVRKNKRRG